MQAPTVALQYAGVSFASAKPSACSLHARVRHVQHQQPCTDPHNCIPHVPCSVCATPPSILRSARYHQAAAQRAGVCRQQLCRSPDLGGPLGQRVDGGRPDVGDDPVGRVQERVHGGVQQPPQALPHALPVILHALARHLIRPPGECIACHVWEAPQHVHAAGTAAGGACWRCSIPACTYMLRSGCDAHSPLVT